MSNDLVNALVIISTYPVTDPKNQDAVNMRDIALNAIEGLRIALKEKSTQSKPNIELDDDTAVYTRDENLRKMSVENCVKTTLRENLGWDWDINLTDSMVDLGADSLDGVELVMAFEAIYQFEIPDEANISIDMTVEDIIQYIKKNAPI